ncbi:MAG: LD-carboxypeptidase [Bacteroidetes bacterium]|nr:LD-carboxypeptidase [Bacteroidota bacterium]MCY4205659.1 LD-carboxypeptidase [Bacteroidota bacterium]
MAYCPVWQPDQALGVVAPASAPRVSEKLDRGLNALFADGYPYHWDSSQLSRREYLSGTDSERASQFNQMLDRTRYLIAIRGGYGCLRILDQINYAAARHSPGILIGYSDITALQLSLFKYAGWRSISGPVVLEWSELNAGMKADVRRLLEGQLPDPFEGLETVRAGQCTGTLLGGNLSMIVRLIGSRYLPDLRGRILFIEDVNEPPYRIDGLLTQLNNAGILAELGGLVVGAFTGNKSTETKTDISVREAILNCVSRYSWPIASGLNYGHFLPRKILPVGVTATLTVDPHRACLEILEPVTK